MIFVLLSHLLCFFRKYIFNLDIWRDVLLLGQSVGNMKLCDIPDRLRDIAHAFCQSGLQRSCPQIPCVLVQPSLVTNELITCQVGGRVINANDKKPIADSNRGQRIECIKSPALELFSRGSPYPSLKTNGQFPTNGDMLGNVLANRYRSPQSVWALTLTGESIAYYPWSGEKAMLSLFDITMGYDRHLYHVAVNEYLPIDQHLLTGDRISFDSVILAKKQPPSYVTSSVLWINSNCVAKSNRTGYMQEFMSYMKVDAWGNCGRNKGPELPPDIAQIHGSNWNTSHFQGKWGASKMALVKNYHFTVAIENSFEHDYVTEKLWQVLAAGSVPLYYGAPNIDDWLPCHDCIVDLRKFANPRAAAEFVMTTVSNVTRYAEFHKWREQPILPKFQKILDYFQRTSSYSIDCIVCDMAHSDNPQLARHRILADIGPMFGSDK